MSNPVYVHISQTKTFYKNTIADKLKEAQKVPFDFDVQRVLSDVDGIQKYYSLITPISHLLEVSVLRNESASHLGIWVIGRGAQVSLFCKLLETIILKIEKETRTARRHHKITLHLSEYRAKLKFKYIKSYLLMFEEIIPYKLASYDKRFWKEEKKYRLQWIKDSSLASLRVFR